MKHILSKELQLYFDRVCAAVTDESNESLRSAALASLRNDPGLHQLLPYFVQFISEKVTHGLKNMFILNMMMELTYALLENENLFIEPYVSSLIPPILTCLIGKRLGDPNSTPNSHISLRDFSASLLRLVCKRFGDSSHTLKPRLTRTCLKHFLDPAKPPGTHYGSIIGLAAIGGRESVRVLVLPNVHLFVENVVRVEMEKGGQGALEAELCLSAVVNVLKLLEEDAPAGKKAAMNGDGAELRDEDRERLVERLGELAAEEVWKLGRPHLVKAVLEPQAGAVGA